MKNFPRTYVHPSGRETTLDETRLLITFKSKIDHKKIERLLRELGLVIDSGDPIENQKQLRTSIVNNSDQRLFVKSVNGDAITDEITGQLQQKLQKSIHWIGPVYRIAATHLPFDAKPSIDRRKRDSCP